MGARSGRPRGALKPSEKVGGGAKPPTFLDGFKAPRDRPDTKNDRFSATSLIHPIWLTPPSGHCRPMAGTRSLLTCHLPCDSLTARHSPGCEVLARSSQMCPGICFLAPGAGFCTSGPGFRPCHGVRRPLPRDMEKIRFTRFRGRRGAAATKSASTQYFLRLPAERPRDPATWPEIYQNLFTSISRIFLSSPRASVAHEHLNRSSGHTRLPSST